MTKTGDRVGPASHHPNETGDDPSAPVRQPVLRPRGTYVSKSDMVTDLLRDLITDGQLSPGTPLRQRYLAEQFEVSNTPVREALRRLESEGLVVTDVHRGATVARTESEELEENYRILAVLEALAGSLAVAKITDDDIADIEASTGRLRRACRMTAGWRNSTGSFTFGSTNARARRCFFSC